MVDGDILFVFTVAVVPLTTVLRTKECSRGDYMGVPSVYAEGRHIFISQAEIEA